MSTSIFPSVPQERTIPEKIALGKTTFQVLKLTCELQDNKQLIRKEIYDTVECLREYILNELENLHAKGWQSKATHFKEINRGFKDIFTYIAQPTEDNLESYSRVRQEGTGSPSDDEKYFSLFFHDVKHRKSLLKLRDDCIAFRRAYLNRFSIRKVREYIEKRTVSVCGPYEKLFQLNFFLIASSASLAVLPQTGFRFFKAKQLVEKEVIPFEFLMVEDSTTSEDISGTSIEKLPSAATICSEYQKKIDLFGFILKIRRYISDCEDGKFTLKHHRNTALIKADLNRFSDLIEKCWCVRPKWFLDNKSFPLNEFEQWLQKELVEEDCEENEVEAVQEDIRKLMFCFTNEFTAQSTLRMRLLKIACKLATDYETFKQSANYKEAMPKAKDPDGIFGYKSQHDCWFTQLKRLEEAIARFKTCVTKDIYDIPLRFAFVESYPIVLASTHIHACFPYDQGLLVGKVFDVIFAPGKEHGTLAAFFKEHNKTVKLLDITVLDELKQFFQIAAPFLNDFASLSKIKKKM